MERRKSGTEAGGDRRRCVRVCVYAKKERFKCLLSCFFESCI